MGFTRDQKWQILSMRSIIKEEFDGQPAPLKEVLKQAHENWEGEYSIESLITLRKEACDQGLFKNVRIAGKWCLTIVDDEVFERWIEQGVVDDDDGGNLSLPEENGMILPRETDISTFRKLNKHRKRRGWVTAWVPAEYDVWVRPKGEKGRPKKVQEI